MANELRVKSPNEEKNNKQQGSWGFPHFVGKCIIAPQHHCLDVNALPSTHLKVFPCQLLCTTNCSLAKYHWWNVFDQRKSKIWKFVTVDPCLFSHQKRQLFPLQLVWISNLDLFVFVPKGRVVLQRSLHPRCLRLRSPCESLGQGWRYFNKRHVKIWC